MNIRLKTRPRGAVRTAARGLLAVLAAAFLGAVSAGAQVTMNPPCKQITVNNTSACTFNGTINTTPAGLFPSPIAPASSNTYVIPIGATADDVTTPYSNTYAFKPIGLGVWRVAAITMGPPDCCVDVTLDLNTCTITISDPVLPYVCND